MKRRDILEQVEFIDTFLRIYGTYLSNESLRILGAIKDAYKAAASEEKTEKKQEKKEQQ